MALMLVILDCKKASTLGRELLISALMNWKMSLITYMSVELHLTSYASIGLSSHTMILPRIEESKVI
jgi:hypothetical protein